MNKIVKNYNDIINQNIYGGKAYWLSWLKKKRFNVPPAIFISANLTKIECHDKKIIIDFFQKELKNKAAKYAIRSSAKNEDSLHSSQAGIYHSITNISSLDVAINSVSKVKSNKTNIGVIIQEYIKASYSGVIFSTNPNIGHKDEMLINYTNGNSENLLNGEDIGKEIKILYSEINKTTNTQFSKNSKPLTELVHLTKQIEKELNFPVDIEWCIDNKTKKLFIIQCRPITNLRFQQTELVKVDINNIHKIPDSIKNNGKIKLRLNASSNNILTTNAFLMIVNHDDYHQLNILKEVDEQISQNKLNLGYCKVLIKPSIINGGVLRMFSSNSNKSLALGIDKMLKLSFRNYWQSVIIFHELYDLHYMGIIKKINSLYLVEISYGGFIQKGITEFSQYIVNTKLKIENKNELIQKFSYEINDGQIVPVEINKKIDPSEKLIKKIIIAFKSFVDKNLTIEFGISKCKDNFTPYLIDYIEDNTRISSKSILDGVVSKGNIKGTVSNISINNDWNKSIQKHFHDGKKYTKTLQNKENIIFIVDKPYISLVEILEKYDNKKIGFIFKEASILSHFCILLRENEIPAIISTKTYKNNKLVEINV